MIRRARAALIGVTLASTACLIEPNPDFIEPNGDAGETDSTDAGMCPEGTLDCDGEPGCESDVTDPSSCGSCSKVCELGGQMMECVEGECVGTVTFTQLPDTYVDSDQPSQNFGLEPNLLVDASRTTFIALPDISELPGAIEHVELHLTCTQVGTALQIQRVETEWDEQQLTASSAPSGSEALGDFDFVLGENAVGLTGMLPSWRVGSSKRSLELSATGPDPLPVEFSSREGASAPYLTVTLSW